MGARCKDMELKEFKAKATKQGFTRKEMWSGIEVEGLTFTIDTCMGGRYWTVRCGKRGVRESWKTLCTRSLMTTAFAKVESEIAKRQ